MKKTLAILLPMSWGIRNVVTSGLLRRLLEQDIHVKLLVSKTAGFERLLPRTGSIEVLPLLTPPAAPVAGYHWLQQLRNMTFSCRNGTFREKRMFNRLLYRRAFRQRALDATVAVLGRLAFAAGFEAVLDNAWMRAVADKFDLTAIRAQLRAAPIDLLFSTTNVSPLEAPYLLAARELGIPTVAAVLSFDNLTSRGKLPPCDHYLVWNERMRDDLLRMYDTATTERITITGTPQFDFHVAPEYRWTRAATLRRLGLPPGASYALYAANHHLWTPTEPALVRELAARMRRDEVLRDLHLAVRLHPLDDLQRWQNCFAAADRVVVSSPWVAEVDSDGWALLGPDDQRLLVSSLAHAELCLNMCSTMSLDAAILDKPVVCLGFSAAPATTEERIYQEAYRQTHYRPLVASGGLEMAHNWEELLALLRRALQTPDAGRAQRRQMVARECGVVDGGAAQRSAALLSELLAEKHVPGFQPQRQ